VEEIMATISGADVTSIKLLTTDLNFTKKREALFNLLRHRAVPLDQVEQIRSHLLILQVFTPLRDDIVHSVWIEGKPQNSIWPVWLSHGPLTAIKPWHDLDKHAKEFVENDEDQVTYTVDNLQEIVENLEGNYAPFQQYAIEVGLVRSPAANASPR
jgi:hypothetical protein